MTTESEFTHFNAQGQVHMVDVGQKALTHRVAIAQGSISMQRSTFEKIQAGDHKKGDVLAVARLAAIMGAKKTADLIPLCHPIALSHIRCDFTFDNETPTIHCTVEAQTTGNTGVEMEALTGVNVALLTIYDMCKAVDRGMTCNNIRLLAKSGGASGDWQAPA